MQVAEEVEIFPGSHIHALSDLLFGLLSLLLGVFCNLFEAKCKLDFADLDCDRFRRLLGLLGLLPGRLAALFLRFSVY
jgi:hypothetical protein